MTDDLPSNQAQAHNLPQLLWKHSNPSYALSFPVTITFDDQPVQAYSTSTFGQFQCYLSAVSFCVSLFCFKILVLCLSTLSEGQSSSAWVLGQVLCHMNVKHSSFSFPSLPFPSLFSELKQEIQPARIQSLTSIHARICSRVEFELRKAAKFSLVSVNR